MTLTVEMIKQIADDMREHSLPVHIVKDKAQAKAMTFQGGHQWQVGEEYYVIPLQGVGN